MAEEGGADVKVAMDEAGTPDPAGCGPPGQWSSQKNFECSEWKALVRMLMDEIQESRERERRLQRKLEDLSLKLTDTRDQVSLLLFRSDREEAAMPNTKTKKEKAGATKATSGSLAARSRTVPTGPIRTVDSCTQGARGRERVSNSMTQSINLQARDACASASGRGTRGESFKSNSSLCNCVGGCSCSSDDEPAAAPVHSEHFVDDVDADVMSNTYASHARVQSITPTRPNALRSADAPYTNARRDRQPPLAEKILDSFESDEEGGIWELVGSQKPTGKKACLYIGNLKADISEEELLLFISRRAEMAGVKVRVYNQRVFKKEAHCCARITVNEGAVETLTLPKFWPRPSYARKWRFSNETMESVTPAASLGKPDVPESAVTDMDKDKNGDTSDGHTSDTATTLTPSPATNKRRRQSTESPTNAEPSGKQRKSQAPTPSTVSNPIPAESALAL